MPLEITAIVLLAAALHAGWNALIKISGDRIAVMAFVTLAGSLISLPFLFFVEGPDPASWPLLALTILLHTGYHFFLPIAYDHGDLGQVYPMARGSAPILVTLGAMVFAGEVLGPLAMAGVLCLAVGVMTLTFDRATGITKKPKAVFFALATGACITDAGMDWIRYDLVSWAAPPVHLSPLAEAADPISVQAVRRFDRRSPRAAAARVPP